METIAEKDKSATDKTQDDTVQTNNVQADNVAKDKDKDKEKKIADKVDSTKEGTVTENTVTDKAVAENISAKTALKKAESKEVESKKASPEQVETEKHLDAAPSRQFDEPTDPKSDDPKSDALEADEPKADSKVEDSTTDEEDAVGKKANSAKSDAPENGPECGSESETATESQSESEDADPIEPPTYKIGKENVPLTTVLESLLFVAEIGIKPSQFAQALECPVEDIQVALKLLGDSYKEEGRGLRVQERAGRYTMVTTPIAAKSIEAFLELDLTTKLSGPALEALSVIAYRQPATRPQIEAVRGVDCGGVLKTLLQHEMVEEVGRLDAPGRPILYGVTDFFMQHFGLTELQDLPPLETTEADMLWAATQIAEDGSGEAAVEEDSDDKADGKDESADDQVAEDQADDVVAANDVATAEDVIATETVFTDANSTEVVDDVVNRVKADD